MCSDRCKHYPLQITQNVNKYSYLYMTIRNWLTVRWLYHNSMIFPRSAVKGLIRSVAGKPAHHDVGLWVGFIVMNIPSPFALCITMMKRKGSWYSLLAAAATIAVLLAMSTHDSWCYRFSTIDSSRVPSPLLARLERMAIHRMPAEQQWKSRRGCSGRSVALKRASRKTKLRREVASFEQTKKEAEQAAQQLQEEKGYQDERWTYSIWSRASVTVPLLKPDGTMQDKHVTFRLFHPQLSSYITVCPVSSIIFTLYPWD
jgi:hypothetical protein